MTPRTLDQVEALLQQAPSSHDRLLAAAKGVVERETRPGLEPSPRDLRQLIFTLAAAVQDCEGGKP